MKRMFWLIPVLLVSVGFFSCSMDADDDDNPFVGTWESTATAGVSITMNKDLTWEFHQSTSGDTQGDTRGTYTYNGKKATAIASEIYMGSWIETEPLITAGTITTDMITSTSEIQNDGRLQVITFEGTFMYTKKD